MSTIPTSEVGVTTESGVTVVHLCELSGEGLIRRLEFRGKYDLAESQRALVDEIARRLGAAPRDWSRAGHSMYGVTIEPVSESS